MGTVFVALIQVEGEHALCMVFDSRQKAGDWIKDLLTNVYGCEVEHKYEDGEWFWTDGGYRATTEIVQKEVN